MTAVAIFVGLSLAFGGFGLIIHTFEQDMAISADAGAVRVGLGTLALICGTFTLVLST